MAITQKGYNFYDLLSVLQKCIRRGLEHDALFFALELESYNDKGSKTALWNRLKVIASEDIGLANPLMPILTKTLYKHYLDVKKNGSRLVFLSNAVISLCRSPKSRISDDLLNVLFLEKEKGITDDLLNVVLLEKEKGLKLEIPDYAYDMHTIKGKAKGRGKNTKEGWRFFYDVSTVLDNEAFPNPYKKRLKQLRNIITIPEIGITKRICANCGKDFIPKDNRVKYCSKECGSEALKKHVLNAVHKFRKKNPNLNITIKEESVMPITQEKKV